MKDKPRPRFSRHLLASILCLPLTTGAAIDLSPTAFWQHGVNASAEALVAGAAGRLHIGGDFIDAIDRQDSHGASDIFITTFSSEGERLWTRVLGSEDNDYLRAVASDADGNLYLVGTTAGAFAAEPAGSFDVVVAKLDGDGSLQWLRQFGSDRYEAGEAIAIDASGNLYIAGRTAGQLGEAPAQGGNDIFVASLTADGEPRWLQQLGTAQADEATALAVVGDTVYLAGHTRGRFDGHPGNGEADIVVQAFSTDGQSLWTKQFGTARPDYAVALAASNDGDLLLLGYSYGDLGTPPNRGDADVFVSRLGPTGEPRWTRQLGSTAADIPQSMTIDRQGNAIVAGYTHGNLAGTETAGNYDSFVAAWSATGALLEVTQFGGRGFTQANAITTTAAGTLFVLGSAATDLDGDPATGEGRIFLGRLGPEAGTNGIIDTWPPTLILRRDADGYAGFAGDSEDVDLDGRLMPREDLNANGAIDYRSEDRNGSGRLDAGEDSDGDGLLNSDSGLASVTLAPGAENLALEVAPFSPGALAATFRIDPIDPAAPGRGRLVIRDRAGNETVRDIDLGPRHCANAIDQIHIAGSGNVHIPQWAASTRDADRQQPDDTLWITRIDNPALFDILPHVSYPSWSLDYRLKPDVSGSATVWYDVVDYATGGKSYHCGGEHFEITVLPAMPTPPEPAAPAPKRLTVVAGVPTPIDLLAQAGIPGTIRAVSQPIHGSVTLDGNTATYQSLPGHSGTDAFSYWVEDEGGNETAHRLLLAVMPGGDDDKRPVISVMGDSDQRRVTAYGGGWGWGLLLIGGAWLRRRAGRATE